MLPPESVGVNVCWQYQHAEVSASYDWFPRTLPHMTFFKAANAELDTVSDKLEMLHGPLGGLIASNRSCKWTT